MTRRGLSALLIGMLTAGCGSGSGSAPTITAPSAPAASTFTLSGTVKDSVSGIGLPNATVVFVDGVNAGRSTLTDATGSYSFPPMAQGGFTVNASLAGFASQQQPVLLASNTSVSFILVKLPAANLSVDGTSAQFAAQADGSFGVSWDMHNLGAGCAGNITGTFASEDINRQVLQVLQWSLPAGTVIQSGQAFSPTACCLTALATQASRFYVVMFNFSSVACR